jgi:uncharacterized membrane protein
MLKIAGMALAFGLAVPAVVVGVETAAFVAGHPFVVAEVERASGPVCHHRPERTLHLDGRAAPVCARCTGMYLGYDGGLILGAGVAPAVVRRPRALGIAVAVGGIATLFAVGAGIAEAIGWLATSNAARVALGVPLGAGPAALAAIGAGVLVLAASTRR